jgi:hypothetical protein
MRNAELEALRAKGITIHPDGQHQCPHCRRRFDWRSTRPSGGGRPAKYCSERCANQANKVRNKGRRRKATDCFVCGSPVTQSVNESRRRASSYCSAECRNTKLACDLPPDHWARWYGKTSPWTPPIPRKRNPRFESGQCVGCGDWFTADMYGNRSHNLYCSTSCAKRSARTRRRARKRNAYVANVRRNQVFAADGWRCYICRRKVVYSALPPDPLAPTLDHVIPLARGGTHEPRNCRLACFRCNCVKSDRGGNEQMLLLAV